MSNPITTCFCHQPGHAPGEGECVFVGEKICGCSGIPDTHHYGALGCKAQEAPKSDVPIAPEECG